MSGRLVSEKRTARQVQPPSAKDVCASLMEACRQPAAANAGAGQRPTLESAKRRRLGPLVSRAAAAAEATLHECLAVGALQPLGRRVRVAGLHFLLLTVARRGGRGLVGQAALHERLAVGALQCLGLRIRVAARHLLLLAVLMRCLGDGLTGHNRQRRTHRHQPCRASHSDSLSRTDEKTPYGTPNAGGYSMSG